MMGLSMGHSHRLEQRQELTLAASKALIHGHLLTLRLALISELNNGERYQPQAQCPKCGRNLTPVEILKGFNSDPRDFTTACTKCGERFAPTLIWSNEHSRIQLPFFCDMQTRAQMSGLEALSPQEFREKHPAIYHSAIAHHGLVRNAFATLGITYPFDEVADVKRKVEPFLGRMPDTVIAELSGIKVRTIRRWRNSANISACTHDWILDEALEHEE